ncbi:MAG: IpaD/SipD/SspD family type III secretion system needle tip protein [Glaciimonas sp.]|nr:IpaD/SipD/SspD family type III secretion system needle tip protein [Glaciimonas sp.]
MPFKGDFLAVYELTLKKNKDFYTEFSNILAEMEDLINQADKENHVSFNSGKLKKLEALLKKYSTVNVFTHKDKAQAVAWVQRLGLPSGNPETNPVEFSVRVKEGDLWVVKLDLKPVQVMISKL